MNSKNIGAAAHASSVPETLALTPQWSAAQRIFFRLLFTLGSGLLILVIYSNAGLAPILRITGVQWVVSQIGSYVSRGESVAIGTGSDQAWQWYMLLGWAILAVIITAAWTALDRSHQNYRGLAGLLHVFTRVGLALSLIIYGLAKVLPTQMGYMALPAYQLQLVGDTSLFHTLWGFMGASSPYSIAVGLVELVSGILLLCRRTWLFGATLAIIATVQVLLLNLFYDVPVKIVASALTIAAFLVLAPGWRNLWYALTNQPGVPPLTLWPASGSRRAGVSVVGTIAKWLAAGLIIINHGTAGAIGLYILHTPRSDLDGVWSANEFTINGSPARVEDRPWTNISITLRGSDTNPALAPASKRYDTLVSQDPTGHTVTWRLEQTGVELNLRAGGNGPRVKITANQISHDLLHISGTIGSNKIEGKYVRRAMQRENSIRLVQPDAQNSSR